MFEIIDKSSRIIRKKIALTPNFNIAVKSFEESCVTGKANCYTYALGIEEHGYAAPGSLQKSKEDAEGYWGENEKVTKCDIFNALIADGLDSVSSPQQAIKDGRSLIACFLRQHQDYHFFKRHADGFWSHKEGCYSGITNLDFADKVITNPRMADTGQYNIFVGYFTLPEDGVVFRCEDDYLERTGLAKPKWYKFWR